MNIGISEYPKQLEKTFFIGSKKKHGENKRKIPQTRKRFKKL